MLSSTFTIRPSDTAREFILTQTSDGRKSEVARGTESEVRVWREIAVATCMAGSGRAEIMRANGRDVGGCEIVTVVTRGYRVCDQEA